MAAAPNFEVLISAVNQASSQLREIAGQVKTLGHTADVTGRSLERMDHPGVFAAIGAHVRLLRQHFGGLGGDVKEVGRSIREHLGEAASRVAEFLPAFGALGGLGSLGGLFELAEHASEAASQIDASARKVGMSAQQFVAFRTAAQLTDVSAASMERGLGRLNRNIGDVAAGKNKDLAGLFRALHINVRGAGGAVLTAADLMPRGRRLRAHD